MQKTSGMLPQNGMPTQRRPFKTFPTSAAMRRAAPKYGTMLPMVGFSARDALGPAAVRLELRKLLVPLLLVFVVSL